MPKSKEAAQATLGNIHRIFTIPEAPDSTLGRIDQAISKDLMGFLHEHIISVERDQDEIEKDFSSSIIPEDPTFVSEYTEFLKNNLVSQSVHTASPGFIGHMTSALPYFMIPLARVLTALNQNLVKVETSRAFTPMERQVLAMLHRLIYNNTEDFYAKWIQNCRFSLGAFCSGGTIANTTALWAARNRLCKPSGDFKGISREGLFKALQHLNCNGLAILVSRRGHYSLGKATDVLGIGRDNLIAVDTDINNRIDLKKLREHHNRLKNEGIRPLAIIGIAGTTETGNVDPLEELADLAQELGCHYHVDAAWGGPTLFSEKYRHLLRGIERADSVTIDAHKQLYTPMGAGMVLFKDPTTLSSIEHHAAYIIRRGSRDLGSRTLEGSRPGMAMLVHAGLSIIGRKGYEILIDRGISLARSFADRIKADPDFELISEPELNILTYRYVPAWLQETLNSAPLEKITRINEVMDKIIESMQKRQREAGKTFVSRTRLTPGRYHGEAVTVFRVVTANPLTTEDIFTSVLEEQRKIAACKDIQKLFSQIREII
ncbi:MAG TPA: putative pyridoxal-dependent aspartate 1-decarboxylase [Deltaproteobacteria bacterium]|nr:putative pyridoxal-dependent aspartate 1-decarboxylase [Deltaproteobacteria bacterium]HQB38320.1 putative pyridoxal-dependent aspartate 1-decarboxylase [Deltaproteobacteria bacterium]